MRSDLRRAALTAALLLALPPLARPPLARAADAPATAPATQPQTSGAADRRATFLMEQRSTLSDLLERFAKASPRRPDEVLKLAIVDGHLSIEPAANVPDEASFPLAEGRGAISFHRMRIGSPEAQVAFIEAQYLRIHGDEATAPAATFIQLMTTPLGAQVSLAEQTPEASTDAQLIDNRRDATEDNGDPPSSKLIFSRRTELDEHEPGAAEERDGRVTHVAPTFVALLEQQHDDVVSATLEAFTSLRAAHVLSGLTEQQVRQVLATDAAPSPESAQRAAAIVEELKKNGVDAVGPMRQALAKQDMAAAIALARADRRGWSADLSSLVDSVLADALPLSQKAARRVLATPTRLVDALYWPDAGVRKAIKARLASVAGEARVAGIDPDGDPYAQTGQIEALRAALLKPATP